MDDFYVPWDGGERYVKRLEARIAELEKVAEAAYNHCNTNTGTEGFYRTRRELQDALKAGYLGVGDE